MEFEYDPNKSQINLAKHGIDFEEAQQLWQDFRRIILDTRSETESRWITVGNIQQKYWTAVYTIRNSKIRLISVRRARTNEVNLYES